MPSLPLGHTCPTCDAKKGEQCRGRLGRGKFHAARRKLVFKQIKETRAAREAARAERERVHVSLPDEPTRKVGRTLSRSEVSTLARRLKELGFTGLDYYWSSSHWRRTRADWYSRWSRACYVCGDPTVQLHHTNYECLGRETDEDLIPLCEHHHRATHFCHVSGKVPLPEAHIRIRMGFDAMYSRRQEARFPT